MSNKIRISHRLLLQQIDRTLKHVLKRKLEVKIVVGVVFHRDVVEFYD